MQEEVSFYMLTILRDDGLFANVYDDYSSFLNAFRTFKSKYPVRAWLLSKVSGSVFDLVVARRDGSLVACLNPLEEIGDNSSDFVKCVKKELNISKME